MSFGSVVVCLPSAARFSSGVLSRAMNWSHKARHGAAWIIPADSPGKETTHWQWEIGGSHCILVKCLFVPAKRCSEREVNLASLKCVCQEGEIGGWGGGAAVRLI